MIINGHVSPVLALAALLLMGVVFGLAVYAALSWRDNRSIARDLAELDRLASELQTVR